MSPHKEKTAHMADLFTGSSINTISQNKRCENNKLRPEDRAVHDWYRFVLSYPPHLVREYIERFDINSEKHVLDPFCGTGTTIVECKKLCIPSIGVEANPMAFFASEVKTDWSIDPDSLMEHADEISKITLEKLEKQGIDDEGFLPLFSIERKIPMEHELLNIPPDAEKLLLKNSISRLPLHKTLVLLETIEAQKDHRFYKHERLALAKALVFKISNLHFGPEVGVCKPKPDVPVVSTWLKCVREIVNDLHEFYSKAGTETLVHNADSRILKNVLKPQSVDAVITSPPYPNEKDYTRTTRLESVILGFINNKQELRSLKKKLLRSNTRGVYKLDTDDLMVADYSEIQRIADSIEKRRVELGKTSGFERMYERVTKLYFGGMLRHLSDLRPILRPGAQLAYVVGDQASYLRIMIRTGQLLADIARSIGYEVIDIDLFRTRLSTATREQLREEVVVLRWPGK